MVSVIVPYYRNPAMLKVHLSLWASYPADVRGIMRLIVVDDGSPEPAATVIGESGFTDLQLYRIQEDIPWNRGGARNLGSHVATTDWLLHMDIDHVLPLESARALVESQLLRDHRDQWFRFRRYRYGRADETRKKDSIPPECEFGEIKPHVDSYLCERELYWRVGGYDEDYSGCLGGGNPFLKQLEVAAPHEVLPIPLHVFTRSAVPDASDCTLSRDKAEYTRRRRMKESSGRTKAINPLRFTWKRVL